MKYYSEKLKKLFDTVKELETAEKEFDKIQAEKSKELEEEKYTDPAQIIQIVRHHYHSLAKNDEGKGYKNSHNYKMKKAVEILAQHMKNVERAQKKLEQYFTEQIDNYTKELNKIKLDFENKKSYY